MLNAICSFHQTTMSLNRERLKYKNISHTSLRTSISFSPQQKQDSGNMGSEAEIVMENKKPRFLCLHGFRTSAEILKKQLHKWPQSVLHKLDLVFLDAPFPAQGKSDVEGIFDPPYYEWFQFNKERTECYNLEECNAYIEDFMIKNGPFDGLLGFSQGGILSATLPGLQAKGVVLTKVPKIKFIVIIGGGKFQISAIGGAFDSPIQIPSLHFIGETDFMKRYGEDLVQSCVDPIVVHHPKGHTVPRLDEKYVKTVMTFIDRIQGLLCTLPRQDREPALK